MNDNNAECGQALPYTLEDLPQVIELCLSTEHHGLVRMLSEIKADADRRLSAQQPAAPAVPRKTNRELHESAAGMNLSDSFFSHSGIDPDGYPPDSVTAPAVPDGFALTISRAEVEALAEYHDLELEGMITTGAAPFDSYSARAKELRALLAASRKDAGQNVGGA